MVIVGGEIPNVSLKLMGRFFEIEELAEGDINVVAVYRAFDVAGYDLVECAADAEMCESDVAGGDVNTYIVKDPPAERKDGLFGLGFVLVFVGGYGVGVEHFILNIDFTGTADAIDIVFQVQFSDDAVNWHNYIIGPFGDLRYVDADKKECLEFPIIAPQMRLRTVSSGCSSSNYFTVTAKAVLQN